MKLKLRTLVIAMLAMAVMIIMAVPVAMGAKPKAPSYTIVIDPGHGGKDPGAQSNGVNEKDINLKVAEKLGEFLKKNIKGVKVIYTRSNDEYVSLQQRAEIANNAKANLFVSIHVNSADVTNPRRASLTGSSTHVYGKGSGNNGDLVIRENGAVKYDGNNKGAEVEITVKSNGSGSNMERTEALAEDILNQLKDVAGRKSRGMTHEPFYVLKATSMPAVLVELDFICNPNAAKYLTSKSGQNKLAKSLFNAIRTYYKKDLGYMASHPVEDDQPEIQVDGVTYVGDGYAIIGSRPSPERKINGNGKTTAAHRQSGNRRRSVAGREASIGNTRTQASVNVRTHVEPQALANRPAQVPQQTTQVAQQSAPAKETQKGKVKNDKKSKPGKATKNVKQNGKQVETTAHHSGKNAKVNRTPAQRRASTTSTQPTAQPVVQSKPAVRQASNGSTSKPTKKKDAKTAQNAVESKKVVKPTEPKKETKKAPEKKKETQQAQKKKEDKKKPKGNKATKVSAPAQSVAVSQPVNLPSTSNGRKPKLNRNVH